MKYYVAKFTIECAPELLQTVRDLLSESACETGFEAFEDTEKGIDGYVQRTLFQRDALDNAIQSLPLDGVKVTYALEEVADQDWNACWEEEGFEPIVVSGDFIVYDAKHTDRSAFAADDGTRRVFIEAQNAFGTGTHQTTRMILRRLLAMDLRGKSVLDCGCGTGILGIAASLLGAESVVGYDIDEWSAANAAHNAALNGVANMRVLLGDVSVLEEVNEQFDVVIANINRNILIADMPAFVAHMKSGGVLLLSGFYVDDVELLKQTAAKNGIAAREVISDEEWACVEFVGL